MDVYLCLLDGWHVEMQKQLPQMIMFCWKDGQPLFSLQNLLGEQHVCGQRNQFLDPPAFSLAPCGQIYDG